MPPGSVSRHSVSVFVVVTDVGVVAGGGVVTGSGVVGVVTGSGVDGVVTGSGAVDVVEGGDVAGVVSDGGVFLVVVGIAVSAGVVLEIMGKIANYIKYEIPGQRIIYNTKYRDNE